MSDVRRRKIRGSHHSCEADGRVARWQPRTDAWPWGADGTAGVERPAFGAQGTDQCQMHRSCKSGGWAASATSELGRLPTHTKNFAWGPEARSAALVCRQALTAGGRRCGAQHCVMSCGQHPSRPATPPHHGAGCCSLCQYASPRHPPPPPFRPIRQVAG